jgi:immune inhibitor A
VIRNIRQQIRSSRALSRADVRLAAAMGMVNADAVRPIGFNDGVFYPPNIVPHAGAAAMRGGAATARARAKVSPMERLSKSTKKGTLHALALMVDFSDNPGSRPAAQFQDMLFNAGNPKSLTSYYKKISRGLLTVTGEVIGYVRAPKPYSYYTNGESGTGETSYPKNTPGLLVDALTEYCKNDNLQRFDVDGDGYVDGIFLIHAGGGAEAEPNPAKRPNMIWSHKWTLPQPFVNQGVSVYAYSTEPEDGRVGVFCHEFGHVLGLPDLYDTSYRSEGVGDWCLMGGGSWGNGGNDPCRMSAWCLSRLGWVRPKNVRRAVTLTLRTLEASKSACYRVWTKGKLGPEYFLLENRQQTGADIALPGSGLAVWHIDETRSGNTNPQSYQVGLVQADGNKDLENGTNRGDDGDLFPGSANVTSASDTTNPSLEANNGTPSKVSLTQISESNGVVKVKVKV